VVDVHHRQRGPHTWPARLVLLVPIAGHQQELRPQDSQKQHHSPSASAAPHGLPFCGGKPRVSTLPIALAAVSSDSAMKPITAAIIKPSCRTLRNPLLIVRSFCQSYSHLVLPTRRRSHRCHLV